MSLLKIKRFKVFNCSQFKLTKQFIDSKLLNYFKVLKIWTSFHQFLKIILVSSKFSININVQIPNWMAHDGMIPSKQIPFRYDDTFLSIVSFWRVILIFISRDGFESKNVGRDMGQFVARVLQVVLAVVQISPILYFEHKFELRNEFQSENSRRENVPPAENAVPFQFLIYGDEVLASPKFASIFIFHVVHMYQIPSTHTNWHHTHFSKLWPCCKFHLHFDIETIFQIDWINFKNLTF